MSDLLPPETVTSAAGEPDEATFRAVYAELRALAAQMLSGEMAGHTLQPTALVHEAFFRLAGVDLAATSLDDRGRIIAAAANAMRQVLVDHVRRKFRLKRGGRFRRLYIDLDAVSAPERVDELLALNDALTAFAAVEPQVAELVTLRFFGGLTLKDAAATLGIPPRTADAHWAYARAWLLAEMRRAEE